MLAIDAFAVGAFAVFMHPHTWLGETPPQHAVSERDPKHFFFGLKEVANLAKVTRRRAGVAAFLEPELPDCVPVATLRGIERRIFIAEAQDASLQTFLLPTARAAELDVER